MAGIGWKLERMLERGTLTSTLQAYLTGVAVTSAPWLLTTAVLVTLRALSDGGSSAEFARVEFLITLAYAALIWLSGSLILAIGVVAAGRVTGWRDPGVVRPAAVGGILTLVAYLLVLYALSVAPLTAVAPLRESATVVAAAWGAVRMGEAVSRGDATRRIVASAVIVAGAILLALDA